MATLYLVVLTEAEATRLEIRRLWLSGKTAADIMRAVGVNVIHVLRAVVGLSRGRT